MAENGTDIYIISGVKKKEAIGWGRYYPTDLTADSVPNVDEWGPDNYWSKEAYIDWFGKNWQKYGYDIAKSKMKRAVEEWGVGGTDLLMYCFDVNFVNFFASHGVDVSTTDCAVYNTIGVVFDNLGNVITDTSQSANNLSSALEGITTVVKWVAPFAALGALVWGVDKYVTPIFPKSKRA